MENLPSVVSSLTSHICYQPIKRCMVFFCLLSCCLIIIIIIIIIIITIIIIIIIFIVHYLKALRSFTIKVLKYY